MTPSPIPPPLSPNTDLRTVLPTTILASPLYQNSNLTGVHTLLGAALAQAREAKLQVARLEADLAISKDRRAKQVRNGSASMATCLWHHTNLGNPRVTHFAMPLRAPVALPCRGRTQPTEKSKTRRAALRDVERLVRPRPLHARSPAVYFWHDQNDCAS